MDGAALCTYARRRRLRELLQRDVLRIGEQIEAWATVRNANVLGIRYTALWDKIDILNRFVGFQVRFSIRVSAETLRYAVDRRYRPVKRMRVMPKTCVWK